MTVDVTCVVVVVVVVCGEEEVEVWWFSVNVIVSTMSAATTHG